MLSLVARRWVRRVFKILDGRLQQGRANHVDKIFQNGSRRRVSAATQVLSFRNMTMSLTFYYMRFDNRWKHFLAIPLTGLVYTAVHQNLVFRVDQSSLACLPHNTEAAWLRVYDQRLIGPASNALVEYLARSAKM
jgi:hypothetical protein